MLVLELYGMNNMLIKEKNATAKIVIIWKVSST